MSNLRKNVKELRLPSLPYKPSVAWMSFVFVAVTIFILGGGIYDLMERPIIVMPSPSQPIWYYSGMSDQTLNESLFFSLALVMGISGVYIAFRSTRHAYQSREARMLLLVGIVLVLLAFISSEVLMSWKGL